MIIIKNIKMKKKIKKKIKKRKILKKKKKMLMTMDLLSLRKKNKIFSL